MKKFWLWLLPIIGAANMAAGIYFINRMPDGSYPVHFDINMEPDRFGSKWSLLIPFAFSLIVPLMYMVYRAATKNNENIQKNGKYELYCIIPVMLIMAALAWVMIFGDFGAKFMPVVMCTVFGVLFIMMGNIMGKVRQNRNFGVKTYATFHNEVVWKKTHRLSGILGVCGGFVMLATAVVIMFINDNHITGWIMLGSLFVAICFFGVIPTIYGNKLYKQLGDDGSYERVIKRNK